jgi:hypothetical protein
MSIRLLAEIKTHSQLYKELSVNSAAHVLISAPPPMMTSWAGEVIVKSDSPVVVQDVGIDFRPKERPAAG